MPLCLACGFLAVLLAGCKTDEAARDEAPRLATVHSAQPQLTDRVPSSVLVPPLRRTASSAQDFVTPGLPVENLPQSPSATASVSSVPLDNGAIRFFVQLAKPYENSVLTEELQKAGLKPFPPDGAAGYFWTRDFAAAGIGRYAMEKLLLARTEEISRRLDQMRTLSLRACRPGWIVWVGPEEPGKFLPGRLVYTGHPMDIALADAGSAPHLFFAVGIQTAQPGPASLYARGGRLFVDADWTLRLGEIKPAGEWKRVPAETDRISVRPDGQVLASLHDGTSLELGWLRVVRLAAFRPIAQEGAVESTAAPQPVALTASESPLLAGHLEYGDIEHFAPAAQSGYLLTARQVLAEMLRALNQPNAAPKAAAASAGAGGPIVIHADLAWTEQHLKALGVPAERTPGHTVIPLDNDPQKVANALAKVLQVLRLRLAIHAQNLRNADRARDAENRLNPYRRKVIKIGPQGEAVEEADPSPFRKVYKPGDPDADADGNITLPNVNSALETTDFQAAAEEYKLVRACMERLAPQQIFPDPPPLPVKPDGR